MLAKFRLVWYNVGGGEQWTVPTVVVIIFDAPARSGA